MYRLDLRPSYNAQDFSIHVILTTLIDGGNVRIICHKRLAPLLSFMLHADDGFFQCTYLNAYLKVIPYHLTLGTLPYLCYQARLSYLGLALES